VHFVLAGSNVSAGNGAMSHFQAYARQIGIGDVVHFLGARADIFSIMGSLAVHALPSFREGCPMAQLEAMACGRPTVASRIDALSEIIEDGRAGILVPPGDHEALAAAIAGLLRGPAQGAALGAAGRLAVQARFTTDHMTRGYENLFLDLMEDRTARGIVQARRA
jgi:glycosyltransferase involved in cell wall biosynthesis